MLKVPDKDRPFLQSIQLVNPALEGDIRHKVEDIIAFSGLFFRFSDEGFRAREAVVGDADDFEISQADSSGFGVEVDGELLS